MDTEAFVKANIAASPLEARIVRKVVKALRDAGNPVVSVWDGEESTPVRTTQDVLMVVFNLDEATLHTATGQFVFLVMGEEWDTLADYAVSLEEALAPVNDYIQSQW